MRWRERLVDEGRRKQWLDQCFLQTKSRHHNVTDCHFNDVVKTPVDIFEDNWRCTWIFAQSSPSCWSQVEVDAVNNGPPSLRLNFFSQKLIVVSGHTASSCLPGTDKWKIEQWKHESRQRGIAQQQENALKTLLYLRVCVRTYNGASTFPSWSCFVLSVFHSSMVHSCCQLADSCFIILFQTLNPKKWTRGGKILLIIAPERCLCTLHSGMWRVGVGQGLFTQNSLMIKRHENDVLFMLLWWELFLSAGAHIFGASGLENISKHGAPSWAINFSSEHVCQSSMCVVFKAIER